MNPIYYLIPIALVLALVVRLYRKNMKTYREKALEALNDALKRISNPTLIVEKLMGNARTIVAASFLWPDADYLEQVLRRYRLQLVTHLIVPRATTNIQASLESDGNSRHYVSSKDETARSIVKVCAATNTARALFRFDGQRAIGVTVCFPLSFVTANPAIDGGAEFQLEAFSKPVGSIKVTHLAA